MPDPILAEIDQRIAQLTKARAAVLASGPSHTLDQTPPPRKKKPPPSPTLKKPLPLTGSKKDRVLTVLQRAKGPLTIDDLAKRTRVKRAHVHTITWELIHRDKTVRRIKPGVYQAK